MPNSDKLRPLNVGDSITKGWVDHLVRRVNEHTEYRGRGLTRGNETVTEKSTFVIRHYLAVSALTLDAGDPWLSCDAVPWLFNVDSKNQYVSANDLSLTERIYFPRLPIHLTEYIEPAATGTLNDVDPTTLSSSIPNNWSEVLKLIPHALLEVTFDMHTGHMVCNIEPRFEMLRVKPTSDVPNDGTLVECNVFNDSGAGTTGRKILAGQFWGPKQDPLPQDTESFASRMTGDNRYSITGCP